MMISESSACWWPGELRRISAPFAISAKAKPYSLNPKPKTLIKGLERQFPFFGPVCVACLGKKG